MAPQYRKELSEDEAMDNHDLNRPFPPNPPLW